MLGWLVVERIKDGHATTLGGASGAVAGLVAITPCAGFVGGMAPIAIGAIAGVVCYLAIGIKRALKLDDSLDVIAVHLVGGLVGSLLLGFFADTSVNRLGFDGVFFGGGTDLLVDQLIAVGADDRCSRRRYLHHRQGHRPHPRPAGRRRRRGHRPRPDPARRDRVRGLNGDEIR